MLYRHSEVFRPMLGVADIRILTLAWSAAYRLPFETCIERAHQTGPVTALAAAGRHFSPQAIQACNQAAAGDTPPGVIAPPSTAGGGVITFPGQ